MAGWAVVTGASGGLGEQLARSLASRGYDLVLVARSRAAMNCIAQDIGECHGVQAVVEVVDLAAPGSAATLSDRLAALGVKPTILVNNAAFGMAGPFVESDARRLQGMLQLDVVSMTELTLIVGGQMVNRGTGRILLVGSMAAYQPTPRMAAYGAAKAFLLSLGEALHVEMGPAVTVTTLSPGLMDTGFNAASGYQTPANLRRTVLATEKVAEIGLDAMFAGKSSVVAGRMNAVMAFSSRLFTRNFSARTAYRMGQDSVRQQEND